MQSWVASGVGYGAIGGAASAAFSLDFVKAIDPTGAPLDIGQQAALGAFSTLVGGVAAGLSGQSALGGVTAGQNEGLNNAGKHPGAGGLLAVAGAVIGGILAAGGSVVGDAATGGLNIAATPAEVTAGIAVGAAGGAALGGKIDDWLAAHGVATSNSADSNEGVTSPTIDPADVAGKTPEEIDQVAKDNGLVPKESLIKFS